jgi:hypothetical protein
LRHRLKSGESERLGKHGGPDEDWLAWSFTMHLLIRSNKYDLSSRERYMQPEDGEHQSYEQPVDVDEPYTK